jgi:hypothetical protein
LFHTLSQFSYSTAGAAKFQALLIYFSSISRYNFMGVLFKVHAVMKVPAAFFVYSGALAVVREDILPCSFKSLLWKKYEPLIP